MKTFVAKQDDIKRQWIVVDAEGVVLGRLATAIASRLRGKHKPIYTPFVDTGDYVVVINANKVRLTGNKITQKVYHRHTRFPGGVKSITAGTQLAGPFPERVLQAAVKGMMPKNILGRRMYMKLKVYAGAEHPHAAQQPVELKLTKE